MLDTRVIELLQSEQSDPIAAACHDFLVAHPDVSSDTVRIPRERAIEIYRLRAQLNAERGGRIIGYDRLLRALAFLPEHVHVHGIHAWPDNFVLFTDENAETLFGILKTPHKEYDLV
jgi:hypothetical protein